MGKITGFLEFDRKVEAYEKVEERIKNYKEFTVPMEEKDLKDQGARCMNCGIPFCHSGCPLGNLIPDFNDAVYQGKWEKAARILHSTNNFPEFTGRLCPAPCEEACVLGINADPVTIENIEKNVVETAFAQGWVTAATPEHRTGKKVAVVGSGPAGLAAAQQLNRAGHQVTVFERDSKVGGLLRFGIPDFKMEKEVIDRRIAIMEEEGIEFKTNTEIGKDIKADQLKEEFDAVLLCGGATVRRGLPIPGAELKGVVQAMDFLKQNNKRVGGEKFEGEELLATGKDVIVIGGGDTGSDCIGTSIRHGATSVSNFEIMPKGTPERPEHQPWPFFPMRLKTSTSHKEGAERFFSISTKEFIGDKDGNLKGLKTVEVEWVKTPFLGPENTLVDQLGIETDERTNVKANGYQTNVPNIFAAGDIRRGQSLIVWAISEGREAAHQIDTFLMGSSTLPTKEKGDLPSV
jgi:glutamate synthase (NADPH/NADH) small chain